ncbi:hypothetical protein EHQ53_07690 [Leptospira langatensis]|uniref:Uncharacterized protein n=1 Tax=Leptospira langatensis TaxID=2484983 RepID=A0A5F1ZUD4_9LEPT|nr:hypothetical protein [Leptospira langatensis]TGK01477.1 hypothetical protein EHO57_11180 [Leptospira langatensis]TGL42073.1 hypothetical protein EHQ53_07690 [Leptospira langatensis]
MLFSRKKLVPLPLGGGMLLSSLLLFFPNILFSQSPPIYAKVLCVGATEGCECRISENQTIRIFHGEAVVLEEFAQNADTWKIRNSSKKSCAYPRKQLKPLAYQSGFRPMQTSRDHSPKSLYHLLQQEDVDALGNVETQSLGAYYPTYYHLALEEAFPGTEIPAYSTSGKEIGRASATFLEQVRWEGSGIAKDGKKYHFAGEGKYELYDLEWGWGAGYNYQVYPYRTLAISFKDLCEKLRSKISSCSKSKVIGALAYIPKIKEKRIRMPDGKHHDGYFCLNDTGSPLYIRDDRMDIFVGIHGGGSPYQPSELSRNIFLDAGINPLYPSDWRLYTSEKERFWCPKDKLPRNPHSPIEGECKLDYHAIAPEKGMEMRIFFRKDGSLIRCKP